MLLRRHFQVPPNSVFSIYNVLISMCSTLKGNRYITLMLTLLFFWPSTHYHKSQTKEIL